MAERGRPKAELELTDDEWETLARWARRPKSSQQLALRSRIVLECASGASNKTSIYGGSNEVQRNIIASTILGL